MTSPREVSIIMLSGNNVLSKEGHQQLLKYEYENTWWFYYTVTKTLVVRRCVGDEKIKKKEVIKAGIIIHAKDCE